MRGEACERPILAEAGEEQTDEVLKVYGFSVDKIKAWRASGLVGVDKK